MQKNWKFKTGIVLIIFSVILFLSLPIIPFLSIDSKDKISISTAVFILAEITFWSGGILLGKELFNKYKAWFNPMNWFKKKAAPGPVEIAVAEDVEPENKNYGYTGQK